MVIVGIISHFALGQQIPAVLSEFIDGLANSFGGAALFYLGLTMVSCTPVLSIFFFLLLRITCFTYHEGYHQLPSSLAGWSA